VAHFEKAQDREAEANRPPRRIFCVSATPRLGAIPSAAPQPVSRSSEPAPRKSVHASPTDMGGCRLAAVSHPARMVAIMTSSQGQAGGPSSCHRGNSLVNSPLGIRP
jgi:hypothetical protein